MTHDEEQAATAARAAESALGAGVKYLELAKDYTAPNVLASSAAWGILAVYHQLRALTAATADHTEALHRHASWMEEHATALRLSTNR